MIYGAFKKAISGNMVCVATTEAESPREAMNNMGRFVSIILNGKRANLLALTAEDLAMDVVRFNTKEFAARLAQA